AEPAGAGRRSARHHRGAARRIAPPRRGSAGHHHSLPVHPSARPLSRRGAASCRGAYGGAEPGRRRTEHAAHGLCAGTRHRLDVRAVVLPRGRTAGTWTARRRYTPRAARDRIPRARPAPAPTPTTRRSRRPVGL
ncbi:MAG: Coenzyme F420-0:L-glutamate ligase @ Coenzyme F420-1:L-glutamate ligase / domain of unknown function, partial [uncultured Chloroflexia bacterium]